MVLKNNNAKFSHVCFDLDGTLVNSFTTIYKCTLRTLQHLNIPGYPEELIMRNMIGYHFLEIFRELKINVEDIESFINIYKSYYFDFIDDSVLYPGTTDLLQILKESNVKISMLTTKAQDQADQIVKHFRLGEYFDVVSGRKPALPVKPDPEPLLRICRELNAAPGETLMTGDSDLDIMCGRNAGTKTCAAAYGYRPLSILQKESPDYLINDIAELEAVVLR